MANKRDITNEGVTVHTIDTSGLINIGDAADQEANGGFRLQFRKNGSSFSGVMKQALRGSTATPAACVYELPLLGTTGISAAITDDAQVVVRLPNGQCYVDVTMTSGVVLIEARPFLDA